MQWSIDVTARPHLFFWMELIHGIRVKAWTCIVQIVFFITLLTSLFFRTIDAIQDQVPFEEFCERILTSNFLRSIHHCSSWDSVFSPPEKNKKKIGLHSHDLYWSKVKITPNKWLDPFLCDWLRSRYIMNWFWLKN